MLLLFSAATFDILSRCFRFVNNFFHLFSRWSAEGGIWTLAPLLTTCTLSRGVPSASWVLLQSPDAWTSVNIILSSASLLLVQRREWDSNPRALADKRFSRPPRYDHLDISPQTCFAILSKLFVFVKNFFKFFYRCFVHVLLVTRDLMNFSIPYCSCQPYFLHFFIFFVFLVWTPISTANQDYIMSALCW